MIHRGRCTFSTCNPGYNLTLTGAATVICQSTDSHWNATQKTCVDRNECTEGVHNCRSASECFNTAGSFFCGCPSWVLTTGTIRCIGANVTNSSLVVYGNAAETAYIGARVTIAQWRADKSVYDTLSGYPKNMTNRLFNVTLTSLDAGVRYHVLVEFQKSSGYNTSWNHEIGNNTGDVATTCGCSSTEKTGSPSNVSAIQVRLIPRKAGLKLF